jgi:hypothetical protein
MAAENGRYGAAGASMARAPKKKKRGKKRKERRGEPSCQHPIMPQSKLTIVKI